MTLETLKDVKEIGGFKIVVMDKLREKYPDLVHKANGQMDAKWFEENIRPYNFIYINHEKNALSFTVQNGSVKENGVNGCQVDTIIETAKTILEGLNEQSRCRENAVAITKLDEAMMWLEKRKKRINKE